MENNLINKKFDELDDKEKIEVLRNEIRNLRYSIQQLNQIRNDIRELQHHQHGQDGSVLVKVNNNIGLNSVCGSSTMIHDRLA